MADSDHFQGRRAQIGVSVFGFQVPGPVLGQLDRHSQTNNLPEGREGTLGELHTHPYVPPLPKNQVNPEKKADMRCR